MHARRPLLVAGNHFRRGNDLFVLDNDLNSDFAHGGSFPSNG